MRRLMKKKVKIFKKEISVFLIVLIGAITLVSAALVPYISNVVTGEVEVSAPIQQWISETGAEESWDEDDFITFAGIHGGESITIFGKSQNLADISITGETNFLVTNPLGLTCDDFESVEVKANINSAGWTPFYSIWSYCVIINDTAVEFDSGVPASWVVGQIDLTETEITFKTNAIGTYTFTSSITPQGP